MQTVVHLQYMNMGTVVCVCEFVYTLLKTFETSRAFAVNSMEKVNFSFLVD